MKFNLIFPILLLLILSLVFAGCLGSAPASDLPSQGNELVSGAANVGVENPTADVVENPTTGVEKNVEANSEPKASDVPALPVDSTTDNIFEEISK